jgi:hypothetical protein
VKPVTTPVKKGFIVPVKDSDQSVDFKEAKDQTDDFLQHQIVKDSL